MMENPKEGLKPTRVVYHHRILKNQVSIKDDTSTSLLTLYSWNWTPQYVLTKERTPRLNEAIWRKTKRVIHVASRVTLLKIVVQKEWCLNDKSMLRWEANSMSEIRKISTRIIRKSRVSSRMTSIFEFEISKNYNKSWTKKSQAQHLHQQKKLTTLSRKRTTNHHIQSRKNLTRTRNMITIMITWHMIFEGLLKKSKKQRSISKTTRLKSWTPLKMP